MNDPVAYLDAIKLRLIASPIIAEYRIVKERATRTDGYLRVRATLVNGDSLELVEAFERGRSEIVVLDYRHQWMDAVQSRLRRRWDGAPHHPELSGFPHHVHAENEEHVIAGHPMSILAILDELERLT
ncbi:MAG: hypothetical protein FJ011_01910 [Chloroflexi bacterium]|nr:hypothetical protein [Chloroflexota bacterium]